MSATVYFADLTAHSDKDSILVKTAKLLEKLYTFKPKTLVGIKTHFGEIGLSTFLSPVFSRAAAEKIKEKGAIPFLFDTTTLYTSGRRTNAAWHITTAVKNGFSYATTGAPVIIADGLTGANSIEVEINTKRVKKAKIAGDIQHMDAVVVLSHFKGHCAMGFGGTLKSIGMGMSCRAGKLEMHSETKPFINNKCTGCEICITYCPAGAIEKTPSPLPVRQAGSPLPTGERVYINPSTCIGCMQCDTKCPVAAIRFNWDAPSNILMEKTAEYALAIMKLKKDNIVFLNFLINITPDCDCYGYSNAPVARDIGVLASTDPVAIDKASVDLVNKETNSDIFRRLWPKIDYNHILEYAEALGVGKREYKIVKI